MKKIILLILVMATAVFVGYRYQTPPLTQIETVKTVQNTEPICFSHETVATEDAPYSVKETIKLLNIQGVITGEKRGTQEGPDMQNGFEGTITGTQVADRISVLYAYTVEGSKNTQEEEYRINGNILEQYRYPLIEKDGILKNDKSKTYDVLIYTKIPCESFTL